MLMLPLKFDKRLFFIFFIAFIFSTIAGTLSHEFGHYVMAKSLGYQPRISYGHCNWEQDEDAKAIDSVFNKYKGDSLPAIDSADIIFLNGIGERQERDDFWIGFGGPAQTMLTGSIGFLMIWWNRKKISESAKLSFYQWVLIFLSLFWLRQVAIFGVILLAWLITGELKFGGDEYGLALKSGLPQWSIILPSALTGLAILWYIVFKIIPGRQRLTFLLSGLAGGVFGYYFWLLWIGPKIMP